MDTERPFVTNPISRGSASRGRCCLKASSKRQKSPFLWLLLIPLQLLVAAVSVWGGIQLDMLVFSGNEATGHGMPVFSALFFLAAAIGTMTVCAVSIFLTIRAWIQKNNGDKQT